MIYKLPDEQHRTNGIWEINSKRDVSGDTANIQLTFEPWGSQEEHTNLLIVAGDFVQYFGVFNGQIQLFGHTFIIENAFGVTENHYAKW
jgi:hypothetical protein